MSAVAQITSVVGLLTIAVVLLTSFLTWLETP